MNTYYPSKVLLAGEYLVLKGANALAIPYAKYKGNWAFSSDNIIDHRLIELGKYIQETDVSFRYEQFFDQINQGLYFESDIPNGYGVGSSGALVAAVYDRFCNSKQDLLRVNSDLKVIESFYHGNSSGIDPIISYFQKSILLKDGDFSFENVDQQMIDSNIFLYDSKKARRTDTLIDQFKTRATDSQYREKLNTLLQLNNELVHALISNHTQLGQVWKALSYAQFSFFDFAIPDDIKTLWEEGFSNNTFFKLCGAGGGGFFLFYKDSY